MITFLIVYAIITILANPAMWENIILDTRGVHDPKMTGVLLFLICTFGTPLYWFVYIVVNAADKLIYSYRVHKKLKDAIEDVIEEDTPAIKAARYKEAKEFLEKHKK